MPGTLLSGGFSETVVSYVLSVCIYTKKGVLERQGPLTPPTLHGSRLPLEKMMLEAASISGGIDPVGA